MLYKIEAFAIFIILDLHTGRNFLCKIDLFVIIVSSKSINKTVLLCGLNNILIKRTEVYAIKFVNPC